MDFLFKYFRAFIMMPIPLSMLFFTYDTWLVKLSLSSIMTSRNLINWTLCKSVVPS